MHSILVRYLAINPQVVNSFNLPHHDFVPSEDPAADAKFLADVSSGKRPRFYVTFSEQVTRARFDILVVDLFNQNVVTSCQVERRRTPFADLNEYVDACWRAAATLATELGAEFRPEPEDAAIHSFQAHVLLRAACARNQAVAVTDWPVAVSQPARLPVMVRALALLMVVFALMFGSVATTHAQTMRPKPPKVPICRMHNGVRYCLPTHGGSGITPPIFQPKQAR